MARRKFEILNGENLRERSPSSRYEIMVGNLDGKPEIYEYVASLEDIGGHLTVYRDIESSTVSVAFDCSDFTSLTLVGDNEGLSRSFNRLAQHIPDIFKFELIKKQ